MSALGALRWRLRPGQVYRRKDLARWSNAVDRHLRALVAEGRLEKVSGGLYMAPSQTRFGAVPAPPQKLVESFLGDDQFLMVSPNAYNGLGVGTTQLYNEPVVYNRKRHGRFTLDGRVYDLRLRPSVPKQLSPELLLVDLLHNLDRLPEDKAEIRPRALARAADRPVKARKSPEGLWLGTGRAPAMPAPPRSIIRASPGSMPSSIASPPGGSASDRHRKAAARGGRATAFPACRTRPGA